MAYVCTQPKLRAAGDCGNCPDYWECVNNQSPEYEPPDYDPNTDHDAE